MGNLDGAAFWATSDAVIPFAPPRQIPFLPIASTPPSRCAPPFVRPFPWQLEIFVGLDNILGAITPIHHMIQCSLATTERYLRLTITNLKEAHTKFHPREKESAAL